MKTNKELIEKYDWLKIRNIRTGNLIDDCEDSSLLESLNIGWRIALGDQMVEELDRILKKANYQNDYRIHQIKEKYGSLRWYDDGVPNIIYDEYSEWLDKYERLSEKTCINCGSQNDVTMTTNGWIIPLCVKCNENKK